LFGRNPVDMLEGRESILRSLFGSSVFCAPDSCPNEIKERCRFPEELAIMDKAALATEQATVEMSLPKGEVRRAAEREYNFGESFSAIWYIEARR
jgi:hypothetical protein